MTGFMALRKPDMEADIQPDKKAVRDDGETVNVMESTQLGEGFKGREEASGAIEVTLRWAEA